MEESTSTTNNANIAEKVETQTTGETQNTEDEDVLRTFIKNQNQSLERFLQQQEMYLKKLTTTSRKRLRDEEDEDVLSLHADEDHEIDSTNVSRESEDILARYSKGLYGKGESKESEQENSDDEDEEANSRYEDLLASTVEKMGQPIENDLADVCSKIWGKALSSDNKKDDFKGILIPSNCKKMKTPRLNTEVYIKLLEGPQNKDRAAQTRQKDTAKAAVPILQAMVELKKTEKTLKRSIKKGQGPATKEVAEAYDNIKTISPMLQRSLKVLNYTFSETMRKRKYDVCTSLGRHFKPFATSDSSEESLFDEDTIKKMKSELKLLKTKTSNRKQFSNNDYHPKNFQSFNKSPRSFNQGNRYTSYNNRNNNENKFNKFNKFQNNKKFQK